MNKLSRKSRIVFRVIMLWWMASLMILAMANIGKGAELSVSPMLIEIEQRPNSEHAFSFSVHAKSSGEIKLTPFGMAQQESGHMEFFAASPGKRESKGPFVLLEKSNLNITANRPVVVKGKVVLPRRVRGTKLFAVMVEEGESESKANGIRINVRYAVIIKVKIAGKHVRERGQFDGIRIEKVNGKPMISGVLSNVSLQDYRVRSHLQLRDGNNRLLERIELKSAATWKNGDERSLVFPGAKVRLMGRLEKVTRPGSYRMRIVNRLGRRGQVVVSGEIEIKPEHLAEALPPSVVSRNPNPVRVTPNPIRIKWRKDRTAFSVLTLVNTQVKAVLVRLPSGPTDGNRTGGYTFVPREVRLAGKGRGRVILKQKQVGSMVNAQQTFTAEVVDESGVSTPLEIRTVSGQGATAHYPNSPKHRISLKNGQG